MNYITILDFMTSDLKLKGNELIVFALIYGFSQNGESEFKGSLTYIQERTNLTRPTVVDVLSKLVDKGYITKREEFRNNTKICSYSASKEILLGVVKFSSFGSKETLPPILYNTKDIKKDIYSQVNEETKTEITEIIKYLNSKTNKSFRAEAKSNREPILARIKEGYQIKDFKKVIDIKTNEWLGTEMDAYLCPQTLFRASNFEKYLNQKVISKKQIEDEVPFV